MMTTTMNPPTITRPDEITIPPDLFEQIARLTIRRDYLNAEYQGNLKQIEFLNKMAKTLHANDPERAAIKKKREAIVKRQMELMDELTPDELRQLILDHPDLPLLVFANEEANSGDYSYTACSEVRAEVGEFLDCMQDVNDKYCFTDRGEFEEDIVDMLFDFNGSEEELEAEVKRIAAEYETYWKPCIIVYVGN